MESAEKVLAFRANMVSLGVGDARLWQELSAAWSVVRVAMLVKLHDAWKAEVEAQV